MRSSFAICSGYEEDAVEIFEPFLKYLPQLTYENMQSALDGSRNISENEIYRRAMDKKPLRSLVFQVISDIFYSFSHLHVLVRHERALASLLSTIQMRLEAVACDQ